MTMSPQIKELISTLPKAELHVHIEGTLTPELMWQLAQKHKIELPFNNIQEIHQAYQFTNLQSFLDIYYQGAMVLIDEDDFYDLMWDYLKDCQRQNIVHAEIMFDPQTHLERGIGFDVFMQGFNKAIEQAKSELGISVYLIMSFLRHLSEDSAFATLEKAKNYYASIKAVGLDSSEVGNPPSKFERVFLRSAELGFSAVAHAGEEGSPEYVWEALKLLNVDRIDHGVRSIEDDKLVAYLKQHQVPLTVCPLSNLKLCVVDKMKDHNILDLLAAGLKVTVNSDDPSYFGGNLNKNFEALASNLPLSIAALFQLIEHSFTASFLPQKDKEKWIIKLHLYKAEIGLKAE